MIVGTKGLMLLFSFFCNCKLVKYQFKYPAILENCPTLETKDMKTFAHFLSVIVLCSGRVIKGSLFLHERTRKKFNVALKTCRSNLASDRY